MKKKTYKQMQNRLYREIKRRIIAENFIMTPQKTAIFQQKIDTVKIRQKVDRTTCLTIDELVIKRDIARKIFDKLYEDGYFTFYTAQSPSDPVIDHIEIECWINAVKPWI